MLQNARVTDFNVSELLRKTNRRGGGGRGGGLNCPPRLSKIFFRVLFKLLPVLAEFFYSNFYQSLLISIHFCLACKLASVISITKSLFVFTFLIMFDTFSIEINYLTYKKEVAKTETLYCDLSNTLLEKANLYSHFQYVYHLSC